MTSQEKVKCAIIGAGWWGTAAHAPAIRRHPDAELVAVQKRKRREAELVAEKLGVPNACITAQEVMGIEGLDAVIISSTPNMHYLQARAALILGSEEIQKGEVTLKDLDLGQQRQVPLRELTRELGLLT